MINEYKMKDENSYRIAEGKTNKLYAHLFPYIEGEEDIIEAFFEHFEFDHTVTVEEMVWFYMIFEVLYEKDTLPFHYYVGNR
ncbi:hypothetical protein [Bacillus weihaiensis]|uniref:hypothetical protein n=1 Tax=Bacillus weihaiensis TaxID=1547283 RepID=UPI002352104D|nr:hypothetical protein [Bacillus weihaiensis]